MNYKRLYQELIELAKTREQLDEYYEEHHIVPKCLHGTDDGENLVDLTAREHYVAHLLLAKIHKGECLRAFYMMGNFLGRKNSRMYKDAREYVAVAAIEIGKKNAQMTMENRTGLFRLTREERSANGTRVYYSEKGLSSRTRQQRQETGRKSGTKTRLEKTGVHARTPEEIQRDASMGGKAAKAQGKGVFARTKEQHSADSRKAGSQRWRCDECGLVTSPGALGKHQNTSKHNGRTRIF